MKFVKNAPIRLLAHLIAHTKQRCQTHKHTYEDIFFVKHTEEYAEMLGIETQVPDTISFLKLIDAPAIPLRAPPQKYAYNAEVIKLRSQGFSIRAIALLTRVSKKNVERMLRENPDAPGLVERN